jgi:hypothetical protein
MRHRVVITVEPGGRLTSKVEGIPGPSCGSVSSWLDSLGKIIQHEDTAEAYEHVNESESTNEKINTGSDW